MAGRTKFGDARVLIPLFLAAFAAAMAVTTITGRFSSPERWEYSQIAENILEGSGAVREYLGTKYYFYGPTLYPAMLAAVLWVTNRLESAMLVLQAVFFACTCVVIYQIASTIFGTAEARLAAGLAALHPGGLIYVGKLHAQTLDVFLLVLSFLLLTQIARTATPLRSVGTGLVAGLAALSRATIVPFLSLWVAWFVWKERQHLSSVLRAVTAFIAAGALVISPVLVRGYLIYGTVIPLRTDTGVNLWYGNHPGASGTSYTMSLAPAPVITQLPPAVSARIGTMNEIDQNRLFIATALEFVRNDPRAAFSLFLKKVYYFWWFSPHSGLLYPAGWWRAYAIYYAVILLFTAVGVVASLRSARPVVRTGGVLFLLMVASVSFTQAIFYVEGRHRWQIEPLLLTFSAAGVLFVFRRLQPPFFFKMREGVHTRC